MKSISFLAPLDWAIIALFFVVSLGIGLAAARKASQSSREFFLSGRSMPWWLLGVSMVATTFSTDTPNLVASLVRKDGVAGNWVWWAFLLSGMLTVYVFAKLWRRAGVLTDVEFYELRYSGKPAAFLRAFRALYLGLIFNVLVMGAVSLAAIKFGNIVLGIEGWKMLLISGAVVLVYSAFGGLRGIIFTDFVQFSLAMIGSIWSAVYLINHERVGGLEALLARPEVAEKTAILPSFDDPSAWIPLLLVPLAIQWWASYFPGSEPGGGGYVAQRIFSAKNERHAMGAALLFNIAHYALRPWPWIMIALASLVVFPTIDSIQEAFPGTDPSLIADDAAYPAMLTLLPRGLLGLVSASLIAAYMSTMSTQVNLGASYLVNDFYQRFMKPNATEKELVLAGRVATVITLCLGCGLGLALSDAGQAFKYLLLLGAGTGAIYILRWFWWRINAVTEIVAMIASLVIASYFTFVYKKPDTVYGELMTSVVPVVLTTAIWVISCYFTRPTDMATLEKFYKTVKPGGPGWAHVRRTSTTDLEEGTGAWGVPFGILCALIGCFTVYGAIATVGLTIYGKTTTALAFGLPTLLLGFLLFKTWGRIKTE